jgi:uncharacterized protein YkwD
MRNVMAVLASFAVLIAACVPASQVITTSGGETSGGTSGTTGTGGTSSSIALDVVSRTNAARASNGLPALTVSAKLMEAARIQAEQMASYQRVDHVISGAQYPTPDSRLAAVGYVYSAAAENIAWNQATPQAVMTSWMASSGHRANILDPSLTQMGAAMARSAKGEPYWVQVFGRPR